MFSCCTGAKSEEVEIENSAKVMQTTNSLSQLCTLTTESND